MKVYLTRVLNTWTLYSIRLDDTDLIVLNTGELVDVLETARLLQVHIDNQDEYQIKLYSLVA